MIDANSEKKFLILKQRLDKLQYHSIIFFFFRKHKYKCKIKFENYNVLKFTYIFILKINK